LGKVRETWEQSTSVKGRVENTSESVEELVAFTP